MLTKKKGPKREKSRVSKSHFRRNDEQHTLATNPGDEQRLALYRVRTAHESVAAARFSEEKLGIRSVDCEPRGLREGENGTEQRCGND